MKNKFFVTFACFIFCLGCGSKIKENNDKIYSRHLQKHLELVIISTPAPADKSDFNHLMLNDGQDMLKMRVKESMDSLWKKKLIRPLLVVGIKATNREEVYGVAGTPDYEGRGKSAEKYENFIKNELPGYVKKMSGVRKFRSVNFAGTNLGGLSAFDVAWHNWHNFDKVGVFSGSFGISDLDTSDPAYSADKNRLIIRKIAASRRKPKLKYWFYAGKESIPDSDKKANSPVAENTKDLIDLIKKKKVCPPDDIFYAEIPGGMNDIVSWSRAFPGFLIWAVGK